MKIRDLYMNNYKKLWVSFLLNILIISFYFTFFDCSYEMNDDYFMKMMACGVFGHPEYRLVFINVISGFVLQKLYLLTSNISWYEVLQAFIIWLSASSMMHVFMNKLSCKQSIIYIALDYMVLFPFVVFMQFTKTTSIATVAGYICIANYIKNNNKTSRNLGLICLCLGMWMRTKMFLVCSAICVAVFIPFVFENKQKLLKLIKIGVLCAIILIFSYTLDVKSYSSDEWKYYSTYNEVMGDLNDFGFPNYDENKEIFENLNIDPFSYSLYSCWIYADNDKLGIDTINAILTKCSTKTFSIGYFFVFIYRLTQYYLRRDSIEFLTLILLFVCTYYCLFSKKNNLNKLSFITCTLFSFATVFYCYYIRLDTFFDRTAIGMILGHIMVTAFLSEYSEVDIKTYKVIIIALTIMGIFSLFNISCIKQSVLGGTNQPTKEEKIYNYVIKDLDHLYISTINEEYDTRDSLFYKPIITEPRNITYLGGWTLNYPLIVDGLKEYNINNLFRDCVNNDKVYILSNEIDMLLKYININYYENATAILIDTVEGVGVYSIVTG